MADSSPRISIVTPSFNQGKFLQACVESGLNQRYPNLEHIIIDGGSTDDSVPILRKYQDRLASWVSEPDHGQFDAVNKGFAKATGDIMAMLNSDDMYLPDAFRTVAEIFAAFPQVEWITSNYRTLFDEVGRIIACRPYGGFNRDAFFRGANHRLHLGIPIQQESTFWRRSLWERAGGRVDACLHYSADFDLWARFFQHAELHAVCTPLGGFRRHADQKTSAQWRECFEETEMVFRRHGGKPRAKVKNLMNRVGTKLPLLRHLKRALVPLGLAYPTKQIVRQAGTWVIRESCIL